LCFNPRAREGRDINIEESKLTKQEIITALFGARNSPGYAKYNQHKGGRIILKLKEKRV
jgi:hypothetical protein